MYTLIMLVHLWLGLQNWAYLHTKLAYFWTSTYNILWSARAMTMKSYALFTEQYQSKVSLQNMNIFSTDQEKYHFLNMCNLRKYVCPVLAGPVPFDGGLLVTDDHEFWSFSWYLKSWSRARTEFDKFPTVMRSVLHGQQKSRSIVK